MYGNIIGDLAGLIYEYGQIKKVSQITIDKLITKDSFISDDTVLTIAIIDAILNGKKHEEKMREYGLKYENFVKVNVPHFEKTFSPGFVKWIHGNFEGQSCGNGAMMRIAPIGYLFNSLEEVEEQTKLATMPSHNSKEAIECATIIAKIIFLARKGFSKDEL